MLWFASDHFSLPFEFLASPTLRHSLFIFMCVYCGGLRFTASRRLYSDLKHLLHKNLHVFLVFKGFLKIFFLIKQKRECRKCYI